jgi:hypothetical protein
MDKMQPLAPQMAFKIDVLQTGGDGFDFAALMLEQERGTSTILSDCKKNGGSAYYVLNDKENIQTTKDQNKADMFASLTTYSFSTKQDADTAWEMADECLEYMDYDSSKTNNIQLFSKDMDSTSASSSSSSSSSSTSTTNPTTPKDNDTVAMDDSDDDNDCHHDKKTSNKNVDLATCQQQLADQANRFATDLEMLHKAIEKSQEQHQHQKSSRRSSDAFVTKIKSRLSRMAHMARINPYDYVCCISPNTLNDHQTTSKTTARTTRFNSKSKKNK